MADIFDNTILCNNCEVKMNPIKTERNGFVLRAVQCPECHAKIVHPADEAEYTRFVDLKSKEFKVKMRMVGNSYAVSIPKEIVSFIREQEKIMDDMVKLCFEDFGRLSLNFGEFEENGSQVRSRVVKASEVRVVRNGKPVFHGKQFHDSANPQRSQKVVEIAEKEEEEEY